MICSLALLWHRDRSYAGMKNLFCGWRELVLCGWRELVLCGWRELVLRLAWVCLLICIIVFLSGRAVERLFD